MTGHEFDNQSGPFEAGIGLTVPLTFKAMPCSGREALERRKP
ncbi:hypothetical protein [Salipiger pallidus]|nr:hypothetical protein [Salipiger pallidus]